MTETTTEHLVEYCYHDADPEGYWIEIFVDRQSYARLGPFDTRQERQRNLDDLLGMMKHFGARDMVPRSQ